MFRTIHPLRRPSAALAALLAGLLAAGCSPTVTTHGFRPAPERLAEVQPGVSTREDVYGLLGSPSSVGSFDGAPWYYVTRTTERRSFYQSEMVAQDVVTITFDDNGVVSQVNENGIETAQAIDPVDRETPTVGNELTVLEQFVGNLGRFNLPRDADTGGF